MDVLVGLIFKCLQPQVLFGGCVSYSWFLLSSLFLQTALRCFAVFLQMNSCASSNVGLPLASLFPTSNEVTGKIS